MPLYEFMCRSCSHITEDLCSFEDRTRARECPHCETLTATYIPSAHGGYKMDSGPSSVRPKSAGSFKRSKVNG